MDQEAPKTDHKVSSEMDDKLSESKRRTSKAIVVAKAIVKPLRGARKHYLDDQDLTRYGITRTYIDFASGRLGEGSEQFIEPIDPDLIEECVREARVDDDLRHPDPDGSFFYDDHLEACFFNILILRDLRDSYDKDGYGPSIINVRTLWRDETTPHDILWQRGRDHCNWDAQDMLRWRLGSSDKHSLHSPDPNVPHTTCLLANQEPLRDDKLSTAEMITVVWLSCAHYLYPEYQGHNNIPVTVFSTSRRSIRIVQGVINFRERTVEVRVSDIISFEEGCLKDHWREWLTLLGWAVGKPVGNTK